MKEKETWKEIHNDSLNYLTNTVLQQFEIQNAFTLKGQNFRNQEGMETAYQTLLKALAIPYQNLVKPTQKHTNHVLVITEKQNSNTADIRLPYLEGIDGLITNQKNIALATTSADCLCIVLYDPVKKVLGNIHSGWRGTFQKIVVQAVQEMKKTFHCEPKDFYAFFTPAIRQCHFEVEEDVMKECQNIFGAYPQWNEIMKMGRVVEGVQKYNMDNILLNRVMLEEEGVLPEHMDDSGLCSVCCQEKIHSRRAEGENFGLGTTVVMMS